MPRKPNIKVAAEKLAERYPHASIGHDGEAIHLNLEKKESGAKYPSEFEGYEVKVKVIGKITARAASRKTKFK